jgi:hypothetical protein
MRTTIDLPDGLYRKAKAFAALKGLTLKQFLIRVVERELATNNVTIENKRVRLPLIPSKRPGSVDLSGDRLSRILDWEDLDVPS